MAVSNFFVVIPAAGLGSRTGLSTPKQFILIGTQPVIYHTVESFLSCEKVSKIIVVASSDKIQHMQQVINSLPLHLRHERVEVCLGGQTRHQSIFMGLQCLKNGGVHENQVVVIHDGVRPFINMDILLEVVLAAEKYHAAGIAVNLVSTVISLSNENFLKEVLDRSKYRASEMPQAFNLALILKAYEKCPEDVLISGTECLDLVKTYLSPPVYPKLIVADHLDSWKITHSKDLYTARCMARAKQNVGIENGKCYEGLWNEISKKLLEKFNSIVDRDCRFEQFYYQNYVIFHPNMAISDLIRRSEQKCSAFKSSLTKNITVVNITFDSESSFDLQVLQKIARRVADQEDKLTLYYVVTKFNLSDNMLTRISQLVTSLLVDANRFLSGEIIYF